MNETFQGAAVVAMLVVILKSVFDFVRDMKRNGASTAPDLQEFRMYHIEAAKIQTRTVGILEELAIAGRERANRSEELHRQVSDRLDDIEHLLRK